MDVARSINYQPLIICVLVTALLPSVASGCELTMGWEPWKPYQYRASDGQVKGLDIELVRAIAQQMDCDLILKRRPWKRHLRDLEKGDIDMAAGADYTEHREQFARFSHTYRTETVQLFVRAGEAAQFQMDDVEDIADEKFTLGVSLGYNYGNEFEELRQSSAVSDRIEEVRNDMLNYRMLARGRVDGVLTDPAVLYARTQGTELEGQFEPYPLRVKVVPVRVMFSRDSTAPELVNRFNNALNDISNNGMYNQIMNSYLPLEVSR